MESLRCGEIVPGHQFSKFPGNMHASQLRIMGIFISDWLASMYSHHLHVVTIKCAVGLWKHKLPENKPCLWLWFEMEISPLFNFASFPFCFGLQQIVLLLCYLLNTLSSLEYTTREKYLGANTIILYTNPAGIWLKAIYKVSVINN